MLFLQIGDVVWLARVCDFKKRAAEMVFEAVVVELKGDTAITVPVARLKEYSKAQQFQKKHFWTEIDRINLLAESMIVWRTKEKMTQAFATAQTVKSYKSSLRDLLNTGIGRLVG